MALCQLKLQNSFRLSENDEIQWRVGKTNFISTIKSYFIYIEFAFAKNIEIKKMII